MRANVNPVSNHGTSYEPMMDFSIYIRLICISGGRSLSAEKFPRSEVKAENRSVGRCVLSTARLNAQPTLPQNESQTDSAEIICLLLFFLKRDESPSSVNEAHTKTLSD